MVMVVFDDDFVLIIVGAGKSRNGKDPGRFAQI